MSNGLFTKAFVLGRPGHRFSVVQVDHIRIGIFWISHLEVGFSE